MFKKNIEYEPYQPPTQWRKIALATWQSVGDPSIYGWIDFDAAPIRKVIEAHKAKGDHISVTTIVARAVAVAISAYPTINSVIRWGRIYQRKHIDIFLQVAGDAENLSGITIRQCDQKSLSQIAAEIREKAGRIKKGNDAEFKKIKRQLQRIPGWAMRFATNLIAFINYTLNSWSPVFGNPRDTFGSAMVTSVGVLNLQRGFAPLVPYSRCPIVVTVGKMEAKPVVKDGQVVAGEVLPVCVTLDHRVVDGLGASKMFKAVKAYMKEPH